MRKTSTMPVSQPPFKGACKSVAGNYTTRTSTYLPQLLTFKANTTIFDPELNSKDEEIAKLKHELLQKDELVKNITFHRSHNVRRPLANILGIIELMDTDEQGTHPAELQELIGLLKTSADDLDQAIRQYQVAGKL